MARSRTALVAAGLAVSLLASGCSALEKALDGGSVAGDFPSRNVEIMVPAAPGGGWDLTARQFQHVIQEDKLLPGRSVSVVNVTGAGGAVGISKLVTKNRKDPHTLMITGLVMVGALTLNQSQITVSDTTPIATLTAEQEVIVVKADSPLKSLKDLVEMYKADPASVSWGGGTIGGTDHITAGTLVKAAGLEPSKVKYISYSGGGEATAAILSGDVTVGISGMSEFEEQITAGKMRVLATTGAEPLTVVGKQLPTMKSEGYDAEVQNWRAIVAPPDLPDADRLRLIDFVSKVNASPEWAEIRKKQGWTEFFKTGDDAKHFIADETTRVQALLKELGIV
ncbi:tripartite tricarboxylate transporter substrate binding protein [Kribbella sandramycini]|uniref:Putative tricarboxylic transport membrane protein n=1 Tax=Kribbella sandramycini TaxID=60450 RepID=A0A7Y4P050_9ACTN|nr:tripartite tricarboxylate transporter substrate binding protein [Kribbella sandramycini]MBB6569482.1 putative tricarboxylic transport membrane protein [Kribbella sandramycini]NOL40684.1 tripartite tricarboxylate transporter substrate binding protein [Kribbella sandramycini]